MQEIQWQYYPHVAKNSIARAFIESQAKRQKRPKTIDAYARNLEDLIRTFANLEYADLIEAGPDLLEMYIDNLYHRAPARIRNKVTSQPGENLSPNTIHQRIVTARLFYDFCIYRGYRQDKTNPILRGSLGYGDTPPQKGVVSHKQRLPWIPYDFDWSARLVTIRPETSKSGFQRTVTYSRSAGDVLTRYLWNERANILAAFGGDQKGPLFLSESNRNAGCAITLGTFNDMIEQVRVAVELPYLTTHTFRHLRCTVLKRCGIDLQDIALYAGHQSVATTQLYIHLAPSELNKRIREATAPFDARMERLVESAVTHE